MAKQAADKGSIKNLVKVIIPVKSPKKGSYRFRTFMVEEQDVPKLLQDQIG